MNREQKAEWIESQFGVAFVLRPDPVDGTPESTLTEQEVVKIVDALTDKLIKTIDILGRLDEEKARAAIQSAAQLIPATLLASATKVNEVLRARMYWESLPQGQKLSQAQREELSRAATRWLDLENTLTPDEYTVYIQRWQMLHTAGVVSESDVRRDLGFRADPVVEVHLEANRTGKLSEHGKRLQAYLENHQKPGESIRDTERRLMSDPDSEYRKLAAESYREATHTPDPSMDDAARDRAVSGWASMGRAAQEGLETGPAKGAQVGIPSMSETIRQAVSQSEAEKLARIRNRMGDR